MTELVIDLAGIQSHAAFRRIDLAANNGLSQCSVGLESMQAPLSCDYITLL